MTDRQKREAAVANAVIDAVVALLRVELSNAWNGVEIIRKVEAMRSAHD